MRRRATTALKLKRRQKNNWRRFIVLAVAIASSLFVIFTQLQVDAQSYLAKLTSQINSKSSESLVIATELSPSSLPVPQTHPLPFTLKQWQDTTGTDDYFSEVKPTPVGYLIWFQFPVQVYVEQPPTQAEASPSLERFHSWVEAVIQAVQEWSVYLPLEVVAKPEGADVSILRSRPPLQAALNRETGQFNLPRIRAAATSYKFYLKTQSQAVLAHRFTIQLSPDQTVDYTLATARHELGHALGIWGHSPLESDTMFFSQVRNSPQISTRDINTLKRVYEQPTRLGWSLPSQPSGGE